ncbi:hypothetical protein AKJ55_00780 [candidate division MSBL1 archaeon SCGC-AAA382M17]|uniref:Glycosyltransferase 2-like domain-containing protein n=1 Tax=candidate division MSBL1 archaeon SCGC-AAA382M17 TaxID=1698284 RepID=A0ABR5TJU2_9EURY|nr:hypothetical protein AKJ55_00780 [candidate division MSBL1 archaeon SCGC-AAA382M17]
MVEMSIIFPTMNSADYIDDCLKMICYQKFEKEYEVLVGFEESTDNTREILERYPLKIYDIEPGEFHHARTRNEMIDYVDSKYVVLISDDVVPKDHDWLSEMWKIIESDEKTAGLFGKELSKQNTTPMEEFYKHYNYPDSRFIITEDSLDSLEKYKNYFTFTNTIIRKSVWKNHPFNTEILNSGDKDWALEAVLNGYKIVYDPSFPVYHSHNFTISGIFKRFFDYGVALEQSEYQKEYEKIDSNKNLISEGIDYFNKEFKYFKDKGYEEKIFYAFLYDIGRFIGFNLGKKHNIFPKFLKSKMSLEIPKLS